MKREIYNLGDEEFAFFINRIAEELRYRDIPYAFVGGVAVQSQILKRLTKKYNADISHLILNSDVRFQDYVRATDDVDLALKFPTDEKGNVSPENLEKIIDVCEHIEGVYLSGDHKHLFEYLLQRNGIRRPVFSVSIDDNQQENLFLNISRESRNLRRISYQFYEEFIDAGEDLTIPYSSSFSLRIKTYRPEHILATKISQLRAKDMMDIKNLVEIMQQCGEEVDAKELERILIPCHLINYERFGSLTGISVDVDLNGHS